MRSVVSTKTKICMDNQSRIHAGSIDVSIIEASPRLRLRRPRDKMKVICQKPLELDAVEICCRSACYCDHEPHDSSPIFQLTPDAQRGPKTSRKLRSGFAQRGQRAGKVGNRSEKKQIPERRENFGNFSEFDDYSLIISEGSGLAGLGSTNSNNIAIADPNVAEDEDDDDDDDDDDEIFMSADTSQLNTYQSTPARTETGPHRRIPPLAVHLEALSLSVIEDSPKGLCSSGGQRSSNVSKSSRRPYRVSNRYSHFSDLTNNSLFQTSLKSIAESDDEQYSIDLMDSPKIQTHSYDAILPNSLQARVSEDTKNLVGSAEKENQRPDRSAQSCLFGRMDDFELCTTPRSTSLKVERRFPCLASGSKRISCTSELVESGHSLEMLASVNVPDTLHMVCPRSEILHQCEQEDFLPFSECYTASQLSSCKKIGEGVYGEVFSLLSIDEQPLAVKIIPIAGDKLVNDEPQKSLQEILPEIVIAKELSSLRDNAVNRTDTFVHVCRTRCLRGRYPAELLAEWNNYNNRKVSENDSPEMFEEDQLFLLLEFSYGGQDLETYQTQVVHEMRESLIEELVHNKRRNVLIQLANVDQAWSVLRQISLALAAAERELSFEHRDLHLGNVLVNKTKEKIVSYLLDGEEFIVASHGVKVCIIDFTLSRLSKDNCTVYLDLGMDEVLFQGQGDPQFEVYRKMRENNGNLWDTFEPVTNIYWIGFLTNKITKYKFTKTSSKLLRELRHFQRNLSNYDSAFDLVSKEFR